MEHQAIGPTCPSELPLVSVIIPAYNAEAFILDAISSIIVQSYPALEILVVDDGSRDGTVALIERTHPNARVIQQANAGAAAARNTGLRAAKGSLICFLDADDGWFPGKLHAQVAHLQQNPETGVVFHRWHVWHPDSEGNYTVPQIEQCTNAQDVDPELSGWIYHHLLLSCVIHTSTVMMRREVVEQIGLFNTELVTGEDYDYWLRVSRQFRIEQLQGIYSFYRVVEGSLTSKPKQINNEYDVLNHAINHWGVASPDGNSVPPRDLNERLAKLAFDFGYAHYYGGSPKIARQAFAQCLKHQPSRWRALAYFFATFARPDPQP
jgi:glycosyltransferase involved in cell wall biosynthesis